MKPILSSIKRRLSALGRSRSCIMRSGTWRIHSHSVKSCTCPVHCVGTRAGLLSYHRRLPSGKLLELADRPWSAPGGVFRRSLPSTIPTSTASTTTVTAVAAAATTTTVAGHLSQTRIDLLLGLLEHIDKITGLLLVCFG